MRLGILLTTSPLHANTRTVIGLAREARAKGHEVEIFLMEEGLYNLHDPEFLKLREHATLYVCSVNAESLHVPRVEGVRFTSQYDHALLLGRSDRFLVFGPSP